MTIPVIDVFAGPGGLGEGFSVYRDSLTNENPFKIALSIEKDFYAYQTLFLRSFYRQFDQENIPEEYYAFVRGEISKEEMLEAWPSEAENAEREAWRAQLGEDEKAESNEIVDQNIRKALNGTNDWLLIGGPPCQAYSVAGRSRRQEKVLNEKQDKRVGLYKEYLRILAVHNPAIFIMENVPGLLSAKTDTSPIFSNILEDLSDPKKAYYSEYNSNGFHLDCPGYKIYSLVKESENPEDPEFEHQDFIVKAEKYGIPQTRQRVILLGIRKGLETEPQVLKEEEQVCVGDVLQGLPEIRGGISKGVDSGDNWKNILRRIVIGDYSIDQKDKYVWTEIKNQLLKVEEPENDTGQNFVQKPDVNINHYYPSWFLNNDLNGALNHSSRSHMESDLLRYFFISCFGKVKGRSPKLEDFPPELLPAHKNVQAGIDEKKFADRFRVQVWDKPSKTITSHISKDGHYYIHPNPKQCRSFTVREAARIQTFPDDYYFCGPRTAQFHQVGNAVPPLLANKIAGLVSKLFYEFKFKELKQELSTMKL